MNEIKVLDCTLRDGGYCNQWQFGRENILSIMNGLEAANADIIECGYITNAISAYDPNVTQFRTFSQIEDIIAKTKINASYVAMMNYGEYTIDEIPENTNGLISGIRVAFRKKNLDASLELCREIKNKGYNIFIQPMLSLGYTDSEFLSLIDKVNKLEPYSVYIVDSFGSMKSGDLLRLFYLADHNLKNDITLGFHSHNNLQLAYSNAQSLININSNRNMILDSSIMGMGRGAGNLNSELIFQHINEKYGEKYKIVPLLNIIDQILSVFYKQNYWGYSLANYLSATYNSHPNYATYLDNKDTLSFEGMNEIFSQMSDEKRFNYDKVYIETKYTEYMERDKEMCSNQDEFRSIIQGKNVFVIAPGKSIDNFREQITNLSASENIVTISVNFVYPCIDTDFVFIGNRKRLKQLEAIKKPDDLKIIVASNVPVAKYFAKLSYAELINDNHDVSDNSSLMLLKYLVNVGVKKIYIAGIDGYSYNSSDNYSKHQTNFIKSEKEIAAINKGLADIINRLSEKTEIEFVTPSIVQNMIS